MIWGSRAFQGRAAYPGPHRRCASRAWRCLPAPVWARSEWRATAETVNGALIKAYLSNPDINTQRAAVRPDR